MALSFARVQERERVLSGTRRGFGVSGALDHSVVRAIVPTIADLGYSSFWANDVPGGEGLASLAVAAELAENIRLGVGVIPVDRQPAEQIIDRVEALRLPVDRLLIGIGSGGRKQGSIELVRAAIKTLHKRGIRTVVGALGPKMLALSGSEADGVLMNWLTPQAATRSIDIMRGAASGHRTEAIAYVRVAYGDAADARLESESLRYESIPQYAAHFDRMGVRAIETSVSGPTPAALQAGLMAFDGVVDETVVRAITADESPEAYLSLARAAAPEWR
jgi:alkanesulfonate monooxygenase SsuD/methylene tetrahydromethanopterin reductase-like flavin-dependent oxidoreductase (luciferase family)